MTQLTCIEAEELREIADLTVNEVSANALRRAANTIDSQFNRILKLKRIINSAYVSGKINETAASAIDGH